MNKLIQFKDSLGNLLFPKTQICDTIKFRDLGTVTDYSQLDKYVGIAGRIGLEMPGSYGSCFCIMLNDNNANFQIVTHTYGPRGDGYLKVRKNYINANDNKLYWTEWFKLF